MRAWANEAAEWLRVGVSFLLTLLWLPCSIATEALEAAINKLLEEHKEEADED